ncbi:MAG: phage GP46 family protein [Gammaproteobacteria bacterium]|nr:phage GP46 family protein [Gammaproteobacteria bacterium]
MTHLIDIALTDRNGMYDISFGADGDFAMTEGFDTAILMSIFCEQRASESEVPDAIRRRGWIGNLFYNENGFENGSKMWIHLDQGRVTNNVLNAVKDSATTGLEWLIKDGYALDNLAEISVINGGPQLKITTSVSDSKVEARYFDVWSATGT